MVDSSALSIKNVFPGRLKFSFSLKVETCNALADDKFAGTHQLLTNMHALHTGTGGGTELVSLTFFFHIAQYNLLWSFENMPWSKM
jgi:hypothetical protein